MISVFGSSIGTDEIANVTSCMQRQWVGFGADVDAFEEKFMEKFGLKSFAMVDSGSNALYMAVKLLDLPLGSEVIVPTFTWVSCAHAVILAGCKPVFCDVNLKTMNVCKQTVEERVTSKTAAVMVVHYAGLAVDMDGILSLGYPIIEDAAHAVCSTYNGKRCGTIGDVGIYSFDAVKNLTTGEGGGITAKDPRLIERAKIMRYCGIGKSGFDSAMSSKPRWWEYDIKEPFIKMLPTNIAANIGLAQIDRIDELQARRKEIWDTYQKELKGTDGIKLPTVKKDDTHSYFTFCIRTQKRNKLAAYLLNNGIYTTLRYHPLHMNPLYKQVHVTLPYAETLNEEAINIPLHPRMTDADVIKVIGAIKRFYDS